MSRSLELLHKAEQALQSEQQQAQQHGQQDGEQRNADGLSTQVNTEEFRIAPAAVSHAPIQRLVDRLFLATGGRRAVVFSGLERGTGCTWVVGQAAHVLAAQASGSVCVVDANLRFPGLHDFFHVPNHFGLSDAVMDSGSVIDFAKRLTPNLSLLSCGSSEKSQQALTAGERLCSRIQQLRERFDFVLVDAPPLNLYADALRVAAKIDGIVLVLKANASRRETAQKVLQDSKTANVRLLGAVLNQRTFPVPNAIYNRL